MAVREGAITVESLKAAYWKGMATVSTIVIIIICIPLIISKWYFGG